MPGAGLRTRTEGKSIRDFDKKQQEANAMLAEVKRSHVEHLCLSVNPTASKLQNYCKDLSVRCLCRTLTGRTRPPKHQAFSSDCQRLTRVAQKSEKRPGRTYQGSLTNPSENETSEGSQFNVRKVTTNKPLPTMIELELPPWDPQSTSDSFTSMGQGLSPQLCPRG